MNARELARFMRHVRKTPTCWMWTDHLNRVGYGLFHLGGRMRVAHRVSYEHFVSAVPRGYECDHTCNVRECVRPDHIEVVTHAENMRRSHARGRRSSVQVPRSRVAGECSRGHKMTSANTYVVPGTGRKRCRHCMRDRLREHIERRAEQRGGPEHD